MKQLLEEWREYIGEVGMYHDPKTGRWSKRQAGAVKSLTKDGARRAGVDPKHVERGVVTGKDKIQAKMGSSFGRDQCGRLKLSGEEQTPRFKCSDYKKPYAEGLDAWVDEDTVDVDDVIEAFTKSFDEIGVVDEGNGGCEQYRAEWMRNLLLSLNKVALASKGELNKKVEGKEKSQYQDSPIQNDKERKTDRRKAADRRRKLRSMTGVYVEPFNRGEKALLTPNSLFEEEWLSSNPKKA
jgi:hypothetical protein